MLQRWHRRLATRWGAVAALMGVGLLPCPDCGAPLAVHTWPLAVLVWIVGRARRHHQHRLILLQDDTAPEPPDSAQGSDGAAPL